ncbi:MAG: sigma-70 family RNA polymerase sigma factor [Candidatus Omnitrophica bacterium]|nr:sigma-70 family RNA polymerase sigma factor [Candidatus Omnitrophota bacterium]
MTDEKKLVVLSREGDTAAFSILLRSCEKQLRNTAYALCAEEAEDLMQETFIAAFLSIKKFRMQSSFYTWIYRIMMNTAYKKFRRKKRQKSFLNALGRNIRVETENDSPSFEDSRKEKVRGALARLPAMHREIITLYYLEELSLREISENLSISEGTVKSRLFNARTLMKRIIEP